MKITKEELANIIKEEVEKAISEKTATDEQALGALQTDRAKRAYIKMSDEASGGSIERFAQALQKEMDR